LESAPHHTPHYTPHPNPLPKGEREEVAFLKAHPTLVVDTRHFDEAFKLRLLAAIPDLDEETDGLLIHSENFQALNLLQARYREQVKCIYIDPPYNTDASAILYKNDYKHSSWLSLMIDRVSCSRAFLSEDGIYCIAIDDAELHALAFAVSGVFGEASMLGTVCVRANPAGRATLKGFSTAHDYALFVGNTERAIPGALPKSGHQIARYSEQDDIGRFEWVNFRKHGGLNANRAARPKLFYPIYANPSGDVQIPELIWDEAKREWMVLSEPNKDEVVVYPINSRGEEKTWKWGHVTAKKQITDLIAKADSTGKIGIYMKSRMSEGSLPRTLWVDERYSATDYGTNLLTRILGDSQLFSFPKSVYTVQDSLRVGNAIHGTVVLDFFAGSGTTGHAVINLNREDGGRRKFILVEMGDYFDTVLVPRIKKVIFSPEWKDGKPLTPALSPKGRGFGDDAYSSKGRGFGDDAYSSKGRGFGDDAYSSKGRGFGDDAYSAKGRGFEEVALTHKGRGSEEVALSPEGSGFGEVADSSEVRGFGDDAVPPEESGSGDFTLAPQGRGSSEAAGEGTWVQRSPRIIKILRLESYEDTLNNLELTRTDAQQRALEEHDAFREDYVLRYMLDVESRGSASLLNIDRFEDPFNYTLNIATGTAGETKPTVVDLVETFNYLLGLRVKTMDHIGGVRVVTGTNPQGERVLILWRNTKELDNDALDAWFRTQGYNTKDQEYDVIYVNGDNNLETLREADQTWKVRLIEEEFRRLMFDVQDV
jgi:hypothetical protein